MTGDGAKGQVGLFDLQVLGEVGQIPYTCRGHDYQVFNADPTRACIIESGFNRDNMSGPETIISFAAETWGFVNFQPNPVPGSMEEALHPPSNCSGDEALVLEITGDDLMNRGP